MCVSSRNDGEGRDIFDCEDEKGRVERSDGDDVDDVDDVDVDVDVDDERYVCCGDVGEV